MEKWVDSRVVYDGKIVKVKVGQVRLDNGALAEREVIEHPGGVCVIPFTGDSVILVRQYRVALGIHILEAPAGKIEADDKDPLYRGKCELEEETGYRAGRMIPVGSVYSTVGYCSEKVYLYLALDLEKTCQNLDEEEQIEIVEMPLDEVRQKLRAHHFEDGKTIVGLHALLSYLDEEEARPVKV